METGERRIMNTETQGEIPINTSLTAEETQNKAQILSPKTGALSGPTGLAPSTAGLDNPKVIRAELPAHCVRHE
jgi:hypothetical protein